MEGSIEDDIELLHNGHDETTLFDQDGIDRINSGLNPFGLISRGCSVDDSIPQGSLHALKTAFDALQKKHNDQSKKCADLLHKNKAYERMISDAKLSPRLGNMDESNEVHAAGGTSEDEAALAVSRANQGYVQHLQRELLIAQNKLHKTSEELHTLTIRLNETECQLAQVVKEKETLLQSVGSKNDTEVQLLNDQLASEKNTNEHLRHEIENLKHRIDACNSRDADISNYKTNLESSLATAKSELTKTTMQYRELVKQNNDLDKENSALKATCKQYEIEVEISRQQRREAGDDYDDVDGDVIALNKALDLLAAQRDEVKSLKEQVVQQSKVILQIQQNGKILRSKSLSNSLASSSLRQDPYGAVSSPRCDEIYHPPQHPNLVTRRSPLNRRESDRSDYRPSRRVDDFIQPTGNKNVTPMYAVESSPKLARNKFTAVAPVLSPQGSFSKKNELTGTHNISAQQNRVTSPRLGSDLGQGACGLNVEFPLSPRLRQSPGSDREYSPVNDLGTYSSSSRHRSPNIEHNYMNMPTNETTLTSQQGQSNIPLRMTQSEIILRDPKLREESNNIMSRSIFDPVTPLNVTNERSRFVLGEIGQEESRFGQLNLGESNFEIPDREECGPDYENIYIPKTQMDRKHPVEHENDDNYFPVQRRGSPPHEETAEVSVLNICPSCNQEFSRLTLDQFQLHVLNCFDTSDDQPATLQAAGNDDDRTCPMCGAAFPITIAQQAFEQHVLSHFNDDPGTERFEMLQ